LTRLRPNSTNATPRSYSDPRPSTTSSQSSSRQWIVQTLVGS
jgi:hypothetical protein